VIFVVAHAQPAKLISALAAGHMHTALIFLNSIFAFGTLLSVEFDPESRIFLASADSIQPLVKQLAIHRGMRKLITQEAEPSVALFACHIVKFVGSPLLHHTLAASAGTVLQHTVAQCDVGLAQVANVLVIRLSG
jgi:hypothetical protein